MEELMIFRDLLKGAAATGEVVKVDNMAMKATVDVIGRAVLYATPVSRSIPLDYALTRIAGALDFRRRRPRTNSFWPWSAKSRF
jgi:hypothetical protein